MGDTNFDFTENEFSLSLAKSWAKYFKISLELFLNPDILVIDEPDLQKTKGINFWLFGQKKIIHASPEFSAQIKSSIANMEFTQNLSFNLFPSQSGIEGLHHDDLIYIFHLDPKKLRKKPLFDEYRFRALKLKDHLLLKRLQFGCNKFEVKNSWVKITHPYILGCFFGKKLVAVSSIVDFGDAKDIGVLTHPKFRRKGLGTLLISELCKKAIKRDELLLYRCHDGNLGSIKVAQSLGFTKYFEEMTFSVSQNRK